MFAFAATKCKSEGLQTRAIASGMARESGGIVRLRNLVSVAAALALVGTACSRDSGEKSAPASETSTSSPSAKSRLENGDFGDMKSVCGPKPADVENTASDVGVTADSIQVATVADPGTSFRPGLNQEFFDTAEAFTKWCNGLGGINGRKIDLKLRDAKALEFQKRMVEACQEEDFMLVGGGSAFDDTGQMDRLSCGLPNIAGFMVSANASGADLVVNPVPNPPNAVAGGDYWYIKEKFPTEITKTAAMTGALPTLVDQIKKAGNVSKQLGYQQVWTSQYNPAGEPTWRPFAEAMKANGAKGLIYIGEPSGLVGIMKAIQEIGYKLDWVRTDSNNYDQVLVDQGGTAVDGVVTNNSIYPFLDREQAKKNPATQDYIDLIENYTDGGKIASLGAQGLSGWLLFAKSVKECGSDVTRDCVFATALDHEEWTAGGLHAAQLVKDNMPGPCAAVTVVKGGKFVLADDYERDEDIYQCDDKYSIVTDGELADIQLAAGEKCQNPAFKEDPKPSKCVKQ